jgi:hypothetical protein
MRGSTHSQTRARNFEEPLAEHEVDEALGTPAWFATLAADDLLD